MNEQTQVIYRICTQEDRIEITDFLYSIRTELYFDEYANAEIITNVLFERGGVFGGYAGEQLVAVTGYFLGEPARAYANKDVGFVLVAGLAKSHRGTTAFRAGLRFTMETLKRMGVRQVQFHAAEDNAFVNGLYARFARPLRKEKNGRGIPCVLYGNDIDAVLRFVNGRARRTHAHIYNMPPMERSSFAPHA